MKSKVLGLAIITIIGFTACEKYDHLGKCDKGEKDDYKEIVYEPLVKSDECNCIVKGKVKYIEDGVTTALVDYGDGTCDDIAIKTTCVDGDCDHPKSETYEFTFDCSDKEKDVNIKK